MRLSPNVRGLRPSATLALHQKCLRLKLEGRKIYGLGFGQSPFPVPAPVVESLKENAFQKDCLPVKGLAELRKAVADFHRRLHHIPATGEDILVGPGSKELIFLVRRKWMEARNALLSSGPAVAAQSSLLGGQ